LAPYKPKKSGYSELGDDWIGEYGFEGAANIGWNDQDVKEDENPIRAGVVFDLPKFGAEKSSKTAKSKGLISDLTADVQSEQGANQFMGSSFFDKTNEMPDIKYNPEQFVANIDKKNKKKTGKVEF